MSSLPSGVELIRLAAFPVWVLDDDFVELKSKILGLGAI